MDVQILFLVLVGVTVGPTAGLLGSIMVSKRMALVGDALSHVALPGLALGLLLDFNPFLGAFAFLLLVMITTWYLQKSATLPIDAIIGVLFVLALAVGILITPETELLEALFGDIASVTPIDAVITAIIAVLTMYVTMRIYRGMALSIVSRELALSIGIQVERMNLVYLILVATVVAIGIREVGTILVGAVVIVPAAAANYISANLRRYIWISSFFGALSAVSGIVISLYIKVPAGPMVVISGVVLFGISFLLRSRLNPSMR